MGIRSLCSCFVAGALVLAAVVVPRSPLAAAAPPVVAGAWIRPVTGPVAQPFVAPRSRYSAGHRGVDFAVPAGTPVRAANAGEVTFAGSVAGSLHVVIAHGDGLRTSSSFLATIAVRRGQHVERGQVIGTTGAGTGEHAGVLHFGLRVGDVYVDPMLLFAPADLSRLIRLIPVDAPAQEGLDPPALEARDLAASLHLPRGLPGVASPDDAGGDGVWDQLVGAARDTVDVLLAPARVDATLVGAGAGFLWRQAMRIPVVADGVTAADRLWSWVQSRSDCVDDTAAPPGGGGSGHLVLTVAGIDSATDPATGRALDLDTAKLGYHRDEVQSYSYAPDGGPYTREDTWRRIQVSAEAVRTQLRAMQRAHPGREVDLVAHSQGGVVVTEFLLHHYDAADPTLPPIGTVVTVASPLQGAPAASAAARVRQSGAGRAALDGVDDVAGGALPPTGVASTRQLAEGSKLIRGVANDPLPEQIDLTTIGGADDVVVPADHASRRGARSVTLDPAGVADHSGILRDPEALDAIRLALEGRGVPCVGVATGVRGAIEPVLISRAEHTAGAVGGAVGDAVDAASGRGGHR
jgi:triacylglycerol esterase/lipase EstA (alpha/beta hydrolase family)